MTDKTTEEIHELHETYVTAMLEAVATADEALDLAEEADEVAEEAGLAYESAGYAYDIWQTALKSQENSND